MALPPHLATDLRTILGAFGAAHGSAVVPSNQGKALEAWLLMKLAEAADLLPTWHVSLRRGDGSRLPSGAVFNLPGHGSRIPPSNVHAAGYVLIEHLEHADRNLELRGSLQWQGRSGALHECDVSIVPALIGTALRTHGGGYPHGLPGAAIECKDRTAIGTLDETRQTLARLFDLALVTQPVPGWSCRIYENNTHRQWGRRSSKYVSFFARGTFGIARAGTFQPGAQQLGQHYSVGRFGAIYHPSGASLGALLQRFRTTLHTIAAF